MRQYSFDVLDHPSPVSTPVELDDVGLRAAAAAYFPGGNGVTQSEFERLAGDFYRSLHLADRGDIWSERDRHLLKIAVPIADWWVQSHAERNFPRTRNMAIIGCGDGRLAELYVKLALKLKMRELLFNDLFPFHVEATRTRIEALGLDTRDLKIRYLAGDFGTAHLDWMCDIAIAMFFVTPEILDLTSSEALRARRSEFFLGVRRCLHPYGVFIEDIPEPVLPGFYSQLRSATSRILEGLNVMQGERGNLALTHLAKPGGGFPYHIRYMPGVERHLDELHAVGFRSMHAWNESAELASGETDRVDLSTRRIKRLDLWVSS